MSYRFLSLLIIFIVLCKNSNALDSDRGQPIRIQADTALVNETDGTSIYQGNVIILQGTLQVNADEVEIYTSENEVIQIIAKAAKGTTDRLARYQQQTNESKDMVKAEARTITYLIQEGRLHLTGTAKLEQTGDIFTGELLFYDLNQGIVNLNSGESNSRVNMTITPKKVFN